MWGNESEKRAFGGIWPLWYGEPGVRDRRRAVQQLRTLADLGYAPAQFALGWAYFDGDGVRREYTKSFENFMAAARQAYPTAEGMVGNFYVMAKPKHNACEYNPGEAVCWHRLAAEHGNFGAQSNLASAYWLGRGVEKDTVEAYLWASLSIHCSPLRNRIAEVQRDQAAGELTPDQRAEAERRLAELKSRLPHPWSEHMGYWRLLAEHAGVIDGEG